MFRYVGLVIALMKLDAIPDYRLLPTLLLWASSVSFFGIFLAVPLRSQVSFRFLSPICEKEEKKKVLRNSDEDGGKQKREKREATPWKS